MKLNLTIPVLAVRKEPNHRAELINQILFGERIEIIENNKDWLFIKTNHDNYTGWIENQAYYFEYSPEVHSKIIISSFDAAINFKANRIHIPFGSYLNGQNINLLEGSSIPNCNVDQAIEIIQSQLLGAPYLWGGRTGYGIDCSGVTQLFYRLLNIDIPRDAHLQAGLGDDIFLSQTRASDLLYYKNEENKIVHVGIALDQKYIFHSSGNTRIDEYDANGIFNRSLNKYTHTFAFAKRIITHG